MAFRFKKRSYRRDLRANPDTLYVFGDNMARQGYGGQAKEMRDEPNAVGIPTKWTPARDSAAYFSDADFDRVVNTIDLGFLTLITHLERGQDVVWPEDGIGTGLAELDTRAPRIFRYINDRKDLLMMMAEQLKIT